MKGEDMRRYGRHRPSRYQKHKSTMHRSLEVPEGFEFLTIEKIPYEANRVKVVFRKKRR